MVKSSVQEILCEENELAFYTNLKKEEIFKGNSYLH